MNITNYNVVSYKKEGAKKAFFVWNNLKNIYKIHLLESLLKEKLENTGRFRNKIIKYNKITLENSSKLRKRNINEWVYRFFKK